MKSDEKGHQRYSLFHQAGDSHLRNWHQPYVNLFTHGPVIDIGCGPGSFLDLLKERGIEGIGLDLDSGVVEQARQRGHKVYLAHANELTNYAKNAAGIHISHVIEHLWGDDMITLIRDSCTSLQPNGLIVIRTPNWSNENVSGGGFWDDYTHKRPYSLRQLEKIFCDLDLTIISKGYEPFGWEDTYIVGQKCSSGNSPQVHLHCRPPAPSNRDLIERFRKKLKKWILKE